MSTYYNTEESVSSRTDFDATMKWVITNIANKLQIPPEKLRPKGKYTWSVSNVAAEMGLKATTTFYRFKMLEKLKVLKEAGTIRTTHGECVIYEADRELFGKLLSGGLKIPAGLLAEVRKPKGGFPAGDEAVSSPREIRMSAGDRASSPAETSTQIEYSKGTIQNVPVQNEAKKHTEWNMEAYQKALDGITDLKLKKLVADEIKSKLRAFRENGLGDFRPPFEDFLKPAKYRRYSLSS